MIFVLIGLAFLILCILWAGAERALATQKWRCGELSQEIWRLRAQILDLEGGVDEANAPDSLEPFVIGQKVEVSVGSAFVEGRFFGVAGDGKHFIIQTGHTTFPANPDDVWHPEKDEPVVTYRSAAKSVN